MGYEPYATIEDYEALGLEDFDGVESALILASRHIDTLTFNRIIGAGGLKNLTEFQQGIIKEVTCRQARFEYEYADEIDSIFTGYTINGVTARFGDGIGVKLQDGIAISRSLYSILEQTGLCCRLARFIWHKDIRS